MDQTPEPQHAQTLLLAGVEAAWGAPLGRQEQPTPCYMPSLFPVGKLNTIFGFFSEQT